MATKINVGVLNEKGNMLANPKKAVKDREVKAIAEALNGYEVAKNGSLVKAYEDVNGTEFYAVIEFKTTLTHPNNAKKPKAKAKANDAPEITFE